MTDRGSFGILPQKLLCCHFDCQYFFVNLKNVTKHEGTTLLLLLLFRKLNALKTKHLFDFKGSSKPLFIISTLN